MAVNTSTESAPQPPATQWWRTLGLPLLLLSLLVWAVYGLSLANHLTFDDLDTIKNNTAIVSLDNLPILFSKDYFTRTGEYSYRPLVTLSYFLDHALAGKSPRIYHAHNVLLHHLNVLLVFALFNLLWARPGFSLAIAAAFAIHPLHSEAVIFPGFREDLQMTCGMLAMACCLLADRRAPKALWIAGASLAYAAALFAKEGALLAPAVWWIADFMENRRALMPLSLRRRYFPLLIVGLAYVLIRFGVMTNPEAAAMDVIEDIPLVHRIATAPLLFAHYLRKFVWPFPLCIISTIEPLQDFGPAFQMSVAAIVAFLAVWLIAAWRKPWLWPAGFWVGAAFAPVANLHPIVNLWAERFYYSVGVGTCAIAVAAAATFGDAFVRLVAPQRRRSLATAAWAAVGILAWAAALAVFVRLIECRTSLSLWRRTVRNVPTQGTALSTLAKYELDAGHYDRVEKLAADMERYDPWVFRVNWILGENAFRQQKWNVAAGHFERAAAGAADTSVTAGWVRSLAHLGQRERALSVLEKSIEQSPRNAVLIKLRREIAGKDDADSSPSAAKNTGNP